MKTSRTTLPGIRHLRPFLALGLAGGAIWFSVRASEPRDTDRSRPVMRELASPAAPDSGESNLFTGPDGTVYLTWCGQGERSDERAL